MEIMNILTKQQLEDCYTVKGVKTAFYVGNFITEDQERYLLQQIQNSPKPKWRYLKNRALQNWGGLPHPKGMIREDLPKWLQIYVDVISALHLYDDDKKVANHVLVNEYKPGQGIMPHSDGPLYFPVISTISLGCHTILNFYKTNKDGEASNKKEFSLLLEPRSLLVLKDELYTEYMHSIEETVTDVVAGGMIKNKKLLAGQELHGQLENEENEITMERETSRISLTIRNVPKTSKFKFRT